MTALVRLRVRDIFDDLAQAAGSDRPSLRWALVFVVAAHLAGELVLSRVSFPAPAAVAPQQPTLVELELRPSAAKPIPPPLSGPTPPATPAPSQRAPATHARAGAVLARQEAAAAPLDLTGNDFVVGSATAYSGGVTSATGNGERATAAAPAPAPPATPRAPSKARPAAIAGNARWQCQFPPQADADHIDQAQVGLRVDLDARGAVRAVALLDDPGHGFGAEAERCARAKQWTSALDDAGNPTEGTVKIRVRFER